MFTQTTHGPPNYPFKEKKHNLDWVRVLRKCQIKSKTFAESSSHKLVPQIIHLKKKQFRQTILASGTAQIDASRNWNIAISGASSVPDLQVNLDLGSKMHQLRECQELPGVYDSDPAGGGRVTLPLNYH